VQVDPKIVYAALILSIISLGAVAYTSLRLAGALEEQNQALKSLNQTINGLAKTSDVEELQAQIESQQKAIQEINATLAGVATVQDLEQLLNEIRDLQARLQEYPTKEDLAALQAKLRQLEEALNRTYEAIFFPAEIVDGTGDTVVVPSRPERIVSLAPAVTETLYYINALDRLVAVDSYSNWPEWIVEARNNGTLIDVGGPWTPSVEAILAAQPDLVIGVAGIGPQEQIKQILAAYGIPVILLPQESLNDIKRGILIAGYATGNVEEAAAAALEFESALARIQLASPSEARSVALVIWVNPLWIAGSGTFQGDLIEFVGAVNAFSNINGWQSVSPEALLEASPDIIILSGVSIDAFYQFIEETLGDSANTIPAVAQDLVFCIGPPYSDIINRPSPRIVDALTIVQYITYPEIYGATWDNIPRCINATTLPTPPEPPLPEG